jgi:hypothetical protein
MGELCDNGEAVFGNKMGVHRCISTYRIPNTKMFNGRDVIDVFESTSGIFTSADICFALTIKRDAPYIDVAM